MGPNLATSRVLAHNVPIAFTFLEITTESREAMFFLYVLISLFPFNLTGSMGGTGELGRGFDLARGWVIPLPSSLPLPRPLDRPLA